MKSAAVVLVCWIIVVTLVDAGVGELWSPKNENLKDLEAKFGKFEYNVNNLPRLGVLTTTPWPSSYWSTFEDSINYRWNGAESESAVSKYQRAYGGHNLEDAVSASKGVDSIIVKNICRSHAQCETGEVCGIRRNHTFGYCTPNWMGIGDAWAAAAFMEPEPLCPVTYNNVTFKVMDLKALLTFLYDVHLNEVFISTRCYHSADSAPLDIFNRPSSIRCRDMNAGTFHLILANMIGRLDSPFIFDFFYDIQVYNFPLRSYKVRSMERVSVQDASGVFGLTSWNFNPHVASIMNVTLDLSFVVNESEQDGPLVSTGKIDEYTHTEYYNYYLELDEFNNIVGGEWGPESIAEHPDFMWVPTIPLPSNTTQAGISYQKVKELLNASISSKC